MMKLFFLLVAVLLLHQQSSAFSPSAKKLASVESSSSLDDRRAFLAQTIALSGAFLANVAPAQASGGATAGGAYLLSAKQRYNDRVVKGIKGFLALEGSLKGGSVDEAKAYFAADEAGTWGDISTAAYLLANAFRRSSNQAPDSLPAVKKWKAFVKELDALQKKLKKKDAAGSLEIFNGAMEALDAYLAEVDLPSVAELK
ncbi:expressed unknown protein [Seminavis robusta]|uniref:Uncharacterized protein n=1 Tax=Seminavis robusta TaxID=568900 RepID=A0A9N8DHM6_9STRA|nr:expressed unknown protein [Seminavis robusta]|eukprot:Sro150_g068810.1 n/a (200) ;mRNA; f:49043-49756